MQGDKHPSKVHYRNTSQQHTKGTNTSDIKRYILISGKVQGNKGTSQYKRNKQHYRQIERVTNTDKHKYHAQQ